MSRDRWYARLHRWHWIVAALVGVVLVLGTCRSLAQAPPGAAYVPTAAAGEVLAERLCRSCHLLPASPAGSVTAGIPSFAAIANRPGQTRARVVGAMIAAPHPMPDLQLTRDQIDDLTTYLDTLRRDPAAPSLAPAAPGTPRPKGPKPG